MRFDRLRFDRHVFRRAGLRAALAACAAAALAPAAAQNPPGAAATRKPAAAAAAAAPASGVETFSHGRFDQAPIFRPAGEPKNVALLLAGDEGWSARDARVAQSLAREGVLVAGIDMTKLLPKLAGGECLGPDGDLDNFSRHLQARYQLANYREPILVGVGEGATLAYGLLAMATPGTFSGALSFGFCPTLAQPAAAPKPLCKGRGQLQSRARADGKGYELLPKARLGRPWLVFPDTGNQECSVKVTQDFVAQVADAVPMPAGDFGRGDLPQLRNAFAMLAARQEATAAPPSAVGDLPLIEVPPAGTPAPDNADLMAVMISGDGGWAGIDRDLATALTRDGIPVLGFDSLRYFWKARTPASTAKDVERAMRYYLAQWKRTRVLLIGYSQGADVLPFVVNRLPADLRERLASVALLGMGVRADFEFHVGNWISSSDQAIPIAPEAAKLPRGLAVCIYGENDKSAVCPSFDAPDSPLRILKLKGGHHFDGNYDNLALAILGTVRRGAN